MNHCRRDPFDRLLVAQAQVEGLPIMRADRSIRRYDVKMLLA
jgi:PIN domain nuclease of toxin-antitoxin system